MFLLSNYIKIQVCNISEEETASKNKIVTYLTIHNLKQGIEMIIFKLEIKFCFDNFFP